MTDIEWILFETNTDFLIACHSALSTPENSEETDARIAKLKANRERVWNEFVGTGVCAALPGVEREHESQNNRGTSESSEPGDRISIEDVRREECGTDTEKQSEVNGC